MFFNGCIIKDSLYWGHQWPTIYFIEGKKPKKAKENTKEITEDVAVVSRMESLSLKVEEPEKVTIF